MLSKPPILGGGGHRSPRTPAQAREWTHKALQGCCSRASLVVSPPAALFASACSRWGCQQGVAPNPAGHPRQINVRRSELSTRLCWKADCDRACGMHAGSEPSHAFLDGLQPAISPAPAIGKEVRCLQGLMALRMPPPPNTQLIPAPNAAQPCSCAAAGRLTWPHRLQTDLSDVHTSHCSLCEHRGGPSVQRWRQAQPGSRAQRCRRTPYGRARRHCANGAPGSQHAHHPNPDSQAR